MKTVILIPSRLGATRLPRKPLLKINDKTMVEWVYQQATKANMGEVVVACCGDEIANVIHGAGGKAVITNPELPKGTDRVHAALQEIDPNGTYDFVINVQGDMPFISPDIIKESIRPLQMGFDIGTIAAPITDPKDISSASVVKIAMSPVKDDPSVHKAFYFSRSPIAAGTDQYFCHIGVYAYKRHALDAFVKKPVSLLEEAEMLEQLRALEAGMSIGVAIVDHAPDSIDTYADYEHVLTKSYLSLGLSHAS